MDLDGSIPLEGGPVPMRAELRISSGPVSPRYQFWLRVALEAVESHVRLSTALKKPGTAEQLGEAEVPAPVVQALWARWQALDILGLPPLPAPGAPPASRRQVGAPHNEFRLQRGADPALGFAFGPSLASETPPSPRRQVIESLLDLADSMIAPGFKDLFRDDM